MRILWFFCVFLVHIQDFYEWFKHNCSSRYMWQSKNRTSFLQYSMISGSRVSIRHYRFDYECAAFSFGLFGRFNAQSCAESCARFYPTTKLIEYDMFLQSLLVHWNGTASSSCFVDLKFSLNQQLKELDCRLSRVDSHSDCERCETLSSIVDMWICLLYFYCCYLKLG